MIFENRWATTFVDALRRGGGELVAAGYIPLADIAASLDATEPADPADHQTREEEDMPGLLRGVARTAVVAGTATAVSNRVSRRQANRWTQQSEAQAYEQQQQYYAPPHRSTPSRPCSRRAGTGGGTDPIAQLKELAELKNQGILTDAEFQAQKAKILSS